MNDALALLKQKFGR